MEIGIYAKYTLFLRQLHVRYNCHMHRIHSRVAVLPYFILGLAMLIIGLLAIFQIIDNLWPIDTTDIDLIRLTALGQADSTQLLRSSNLEIVFAMLAAVMLAVTGLVLPLAYYLNKRFRKGDSYNFLVIVRQAMWLGIWVSACIWLQMNRTLGLGVGLLVAAVLVTIELLLQVRTRAATISD
jgi:hypothetical protein